MQKTAICVSACVRPVSMDRLLSRQCQVLFIRAGGSSMPGQGKHHDATYVP